MTIDSESEEIEHKRGMQEVARLVFRNRTAPDWLYEVFLHFSWEVSSIYSIVGVQLTKTKMWDSLVEIETLALKLSAALARPWPAAYLTTHTETCSKEFLKEGAHFLSVLKNSAREMRKSSELITADGDVRPGPGKVTLPQRISPQQTCAAIVAEIWAHFHDGQHPKKSSRLVWAVAQEFWVATTGEAGQEGSDTHSKWKNYFPVPDTTELKGLRNKVRRVLGALERQHAPMNEGK
jgi:hypothetical protein